MPVVNFVACLDLDQISADFEISNFSKYPFLAPDEKGDAAVRWA